MRRSERCRLCPWTVSGGCGRCPRPRPSPPRGSSECSSGRCPRSPRSCSSRSPGPGPARSHGPRCPREKCPEQAAWEEGCWSLCSASSLGKGKVPASRSPSCPALRNAQLRKGGLRCRELERASNGDEETRWRRLKVMSI